MIFKDKVMSYLASDRRRTIQITEPGLETTIYYSPITVLEMSKIMTLAQGDNAATHVWTLIEKAEDKEGNKLFSIEDKPFIEKMPWQLVSQITSEMLKIVPLNDLKKTSETTPSS